MKEELNPMNKEKIKEPTQEQLYCWWVHFQWGLAAPDEFFEGLEAGFNGGIQWMLDHGYIELTEKGKNYKPHYKENKPKNNETPKRRR